MAACYLDVSSVSMMCSLTRKDSNITKGWVGLVNNRFVDIDLNTNTAEICNVDGNFNDGARGQYPEGYYWFSTDTRVGPLLGGRVTYLAPPLAATGRARKVSAYYELGTNDLYIASFFGNLKGGLSFDQILTLSLGLKADF